jgi:hypothetical protein
MQHRLKRKKLLRLIPVIIMAAGLMGPAMPLLAQQSTKVYIEDADLLKFSKENGLNVQILMGNAILRQDSTYFYCDTATLYENNNLRAVGKVHINFSDSVHLYGDFMTYNGNSRIAVVDSNGPACLPITWNMTVTWLRHIILPVAGSWMRKMCLPVERDGILPAHTISFSVTQ